MVEKPRFNAHMSYFFRASDTWLQRSRFNAHMSHFFLMSNFFVNEKDSLIVSFGGA